MAGTHGTKRATRNSPMRGPERAPLIARTVRRKERPNCDTARPSTIPRIPEKNTKGRYGWIRER